MDSNLSLTIGFKGQQKINATAVPMQEGYLKLGGIVDSGETEGLAFGLVVSAEKDTPDLFFKGGASSTSVVRGVCVFDDSIAQNSPAHPNTYLPNMQCAVLNHGFMWLESWGKEAEGAIDPVIGCKVIFNSTTGKIEFLSSENSPTDSWKVLEGASVRGYDSDNGVLIYLN